MKITRNPHHTAALGAALALAAFAASAADHKPPEIVVGWDESPPDLFAMAGGYGETPADPIVVPTDPEIEPLPQLRLHPMEFAHSGQLSPKDDCHKHKAAGERHWHLDGTNERGGPCVKVDGETVQFRGNALCAEERAAMYRDRDSWLADWRAHAEALKKCIQSLPGSPGS